MRTEERRHRMVGCDRARRTSGGIDELSCAVEAGCCRGGWVLPCRGCWSGLNMREMEHHIPPMFRKSSMYNIVQLLYIPS